MPLKSPAVPAAASAPPSPDGDVFLTVPETAALLRTSPKAIFAMVERGQLASCVVRIGRRVLVDRARLLASLRSAA